MKEIDCIKFVDDAPGWWGERERISKSLVCKLNVD